MTNISTRLSVTWSETRCGPGWSPRPKLGVGRACAARVGRQGSAIAVDPLAGPAAAELGRTGQRTTNRRRTGGHPSRRAAEAVRSAVPIGSEPRPSDLACKRTLRPRGRPPQVGQPVNRSRVPFFLLLAGKPLLLLPISLEQGILIAQAGRAGPLRFGEHRPARRDQSGPE